MSRCNSVHACCILVARLAAVWSTLPPPVVSPSTLLHRATHATQLPPPASQPLPPPPSQDNATTTTIVLTTNVTQDNEYLKSISQNFMKVLKSKILNLYNGSDVITVGTDGTRLTGGKTETNALNAFTLNGSPNNTTRLNGDTYRYNSEAADNDTMYGEATDDDVIEDDDYYWNDTVTDGATGNFSDVFKIHSKIYKYQLIKVGVLCTVMSIIILFTCKMLLQVFAQFAGREKPAGEL